MWSFDLFEVAFEGKTTMTIKINHESKMFNEILGSAVLL